MRLARVSKRTASSAFGIDTRSLVTSAGLLPSVREEREGLKSSATSLLQHFSSHQALPYHGYGCTCPAHTAARLNSTSSSAASVDYAFEVASASVRFGAGCTNEIGKDVSFMKAKRVLIFTDKNIAAIRGGPLAKVLDSLARERIPEVSVFADTQVEPTDTSFQAAIAAAKAFRPDMFIAVGGGSVIDTAKAANLYYTHESADFLDYVNAPIGKGLPVPGPLKALIAVPTTAGTGSEVTGAAIFDLSSRNAKTGIANRYLKPTLGIVDPLNCATMPPEVAAASGFDVLSHALESFTAIPYHKRSPRPASPAARPAYQGANPVSDINSAYALRLISKFFIRSVKDREDTEANEGMALAAMLAGIGFGNAGVTIPHGASYAISGLNKKYFHNNYPHKGEGVYAENGAIKSLAEVSPEASDAGYRLYSGDSGGASGDGKAFNAVPKPLVPHGVAVILSAPAAFSLTAHTNPARHLFAARLLAGDESAPAIPPSADPEEDKALNARINPLDAGARLSDQLKRYMSTLRVPDGIGQNGVGFTEADIPALVEATLPQRRVLDLAPLKTGREELEKVFRASMKIY